MSLVFYDTETTGTNTSFDQILQFAAIRTDEELNEIERFDTRCRLSPYTVPSPGAMRVTGVPVERLTDPTLPSHYEMVREVREKLLSWSPAIFLGYNSLDFDEHLFRQALYKTLHPPYLTNTDGNARSDVLSMVQAASLFTPNVFQIPIGDKDKPVFKLDRLAPANGFNHEHAHDALADVEATIFLCRRLCDGAPDLWSNFMRFSQKAAVASYIQDERIYCFADFYFGKPYAWLVTTLSQNPIINSEFFVYDLAIDPDSLKDLSDAQLASRLSRSPKPIRRLKSNGCPMLMPADEAPSIASASLLPAAELERRVKVLESDSQFRDRLIVAFAQTREERPLSEHVEELIYTGFTSDDDKALCELFHQLPWEQRANLVERFQDARLKTLALRLIHTEQPDHLPEVVRRAHDQALARRILGGGGTEPWLCLPKAIQEADDLLLSADEIMAPFLQGHRGYLLDWLARASDILN